MCDGDVDGGLFCAVDDPVFRGGFGEWERTGEGFVCTQEVALTGD